VDKPTGPTSHDVVARARRALGTRRVGHTGTLDPLASGLLLLCVGPATRLSQFLVGRDKRYRTTIRFGVETDSLDADGEVVTTDDAWQSLDEERVRAAVTAQEGTRDQVPPAFSAKKVDGVPAHRRVRRGEDVELDAVPVTIHSADVVDVRLPDVELELHVSSGTFVRSIARDLAASLGTSGHVTTLRRTAVGTVGIEDAVPLEMLDATEAALPWIDPIDAVAHLPRYDVDLEGARGLAFGQAISLDGVDTRDVMPGRLYRIALDDRLVAIAELDGDTIRPRKVFVTPDQLPA
jgi:tRNA pseudouridine55 synthase